MDSCPHGACAADESVNPSRRTVLAAITAAAVAIPLFSSNAGAQTSAPGTQPDTVPAGEATWLKTVNVSELAGKPSVSIVGHPIILTCADKKIIALSSKCTHKGCTVKAAPAGALALQCPCHGAKFDLTGKDIGGPHKSPATLAPLFHYPVRLADGIIEVDTSRHVTSDDPDASIALPA